MIKKIIPQNNLLISWSLAYFWEHSRKKPVPSNQIKRSNYLLSVLSSVKDANYTPVQIQKILFLLDRNLGNSIGGPYFNFEAYHYGPFDKNVYKELDKLTTTNDVITGKGGNYTSVKYYSVTASGYQKGLDALNKYSDRERSYITEICSFVKSLSFEKLLKTIYKEYPEMKVNSIFQL